MNKKKNCPSCNSHENGRYCANCGFYLSGDNTNTNKIIVIIIRLLGISELIKIIANIHKPINKIKSILTNDNVIIIGTIMAYIEVIMLLPFIYGKIIVIIAKSVDYPLVIQSTLYNDKYIYYLYSSILSLMFYAVPYIFSLSFIKPTSRSVLFVINLQLSIYVALYVLVADIIKLGAWYFGEKYVPDLFSSSELFAYISFFGFFVLVSVSIFSIYIWKSVLYLRWIAVISLTILFIVISIVDSYFLAYFIYI